MMMIQTTVSSSSTDFNRYLREFSNSGHNIDRVVWKQIKQDAIDKQTIRVNITNKCGYIPYIQFKKRNLVDKDYEGNDIAELVDYILENEKNKLGAKEDMQNCVSNTTHATIDATTATHGTINTSIASNNTIDALNSISNAAATTSTCVMLDPTWYTLSSDLSDRVTIKEKTNKENKNMMFNFDFGKITSDSVRMSMYGIAVKNVEGRYVAYDSANHSVMDVDVLNMPAGNFLYKMPVAIKDIKTGDVVIHNRVPMFVVEVHASTLKVVDIREGAEKEIYLTKSPFGFNFATKVVSLIDMTKVNANAENPFGTMLPFMLMDGSKEMDPMMLMLMLAMNNGMDFSANPMMMYFLMKDGDHKDMLPMLMMMNMNTKKE